MTDPMAHAATSTPVPTRWRILGFLGVAQLMLILDVTVVAVALPTMETDLGLTREAVTWIVSAYTLTFGGLMLLGGRIADLVGAKRVALTGMAVFIAASLMAGLAGSAEILIAGRIGQGVGAAMLSPSALSLVVTLFHGNERNRALGIWSALGGGGAALGVLVGGLLTAGPGWPWVFYINVPIGLAIIVGLAAMLPASAPRVQRPRLDVLGAVLVTASTTALIYGLITAGERGWLTTTTGLFVLLAAVGYLVFTGWQRTASSPLMDIRLLARRPVAIGTFLIAMATGLMIAVFFLGTFYFQHTLGLDALRTGLIFLPVALATMAGASLTGRLIATMGARRLAVLGFAIAALGMMVPALGLSLASAVVGVAIAASGAGALFVVASATALGNVAPHEAGVASGVLSTFHEFGASFGAATISSVAAASLIGTTVAGYTQGFAVAAAAAAISAVVAGLALPAHRAVMH